jgi:hypothetical protein
MEKRAVIIYHPDFDKPGAEGVKAATDMVAQYKDGNTAILAEVKRRGLKPDELRKFEVWISQVEYYIRKVDV